MGSGAMSSCDRTFNLCFKSGEVQEKGNLTATREEYKGQKTAGKEGALCLLTPDDYACPSKASFCR